MNSYAGNPTIVNVQSHRVSLANDIAWIEGLLQTLGNPHLYINRADSELLHIAEAQIFPWSFTRLPASQVKDLFLPSGKIQYMVFTEETSRQMFQAPPNLRPVMFQTSLAVLRGDTPFLGEARPQNFLDFWKGRFVPLLQAQIHSLAPNSHKLAREGQLIYVNREALQSYVAL